MRTINGRCAALVLSAALCVGGSLLSQAQDAPAAVTPPAGGPGGGGDRPPRGNFDPEQFRQRMMDRYREQLEIKNDDEWKLISGRIEKVSEARREVGFGGPMGGFGRGGRGGGPGGPGGPGGGDQAGRRRGPDAGPEAEELQKAIESKASAEDLKTKLAAFRDARKAKEAKLEKAQEELRKLLTTRQEAAAVLAGLLK